jgi:hypothetical protein
LCVYSRVKPCARSARALIARGALLTSLKNFSRSRDFFSRKRASNRAKRGAWRALNRAQRALSVAQRAWCALLLALSMRLALEAHASCLEARFAASISLPLTSGARLTFHRGKRRLVLPGGHGRPHASAARGLDHAASVSRRSRIVTGALHAC